MQSLISLSALFDKKIFRIPDYQRGYSWEKEQLNDFWEDVYNLVDGRYHYTGMLTLKRIPELNSSNMKDERWFVENRGYDAFHIVDGQQRITTFVILINSILNLSTSKGIEYLLGETIENIKERYIVEYNKPQNIIKAYKFGYEEKDYSYKFLRHFILGEKDEGSLTETFYTKNLAFSQFFFDKKIKKVYEKEGINGLERILKILTTNLRFNIHYIDDSFDVFVAFETMNNRGKKLSNLELLKNRLIYLTTLYPKDVLSDVEVSSIRDEINDAWSEIYYQLGKNKDNKLDDDDYLRNHWILYFKYSRKTGDDYVNFLLNKHFIPLSVYDLSEKAKKQTLMPNDILDYVRNIKSTAKYWYYSSNPEDFSKLNQEEVDWILKLDRVGIAYFKPLVVATLAKEDITSEQRLELYKVIEKFIFVYFRMAGYSTTYMSHMGYDFATQLFQDNITVDEIIKFFKDEFDNSISRAVEAFNLNVRDRFERREGYYSWHSLRYFLFEYELSLYEGTHVPKLTDWNAFTRSARDVISVEHIFPQTPTKWYWRNEFRDYTDVEQKRLTNSLGNLLALSQSINSSLQNDEFSKKKEPSNNRRGYYNGSHSEMEVAKYEDWNAESILHRGLHLIDFMEKRWEIEIDDNIKYELLGLEFMKEEREPSEELVKFVLTERDNFSTEKGSPITISDYLEDRNPVMTDMYHALVAELKTEIPNLYEYANNNYIALKLEDGLNLAEVKVQASQLKINIREPEHNPKEIGRRLPDSYGWTLNHEIIIRKYHMLQDVIKLLVKNSGNN